MSHPTFSGFSAPEVPFAIIESEACFPMRSRRWTAGFVLFPLSLWSDAQGVGHWYAFNLPCAANGLLPLSITIASSSESSPAKTRLRYRRTFPSHGRCMAVGVGQATHCEPPPSSMRGTHPSFSTCSDTSVFDVIVACFGHVPVLN